MVSSVTKNKGFYIGRYEVGKDKDNNVVVQKGVDVYNNIRWSNSDDMNNEIGKAYENSVTSTLVYGIQWDATMQFFDNRYIDGIPTDYIANSYVSNSAGKGWYINNYTTGNLSHKTGIDLTDENGKILNKVKNIYDMAGNVFEWTMEAYKTYGRVCSGGSYGSSGSNFPASFRTYNSPSVSSDYLGFRIALYIGI